MCVYHVLSNVSTHTIAVDLKKINGIPTELSPSSLQPSFQLVSSIFLSIFAHRQHLFLSHRIHFCCFHLSPSTCVVSFVLSGSLKHLTPHLAPCIDLAAGNIPITCDSHSHRLPLSLPLKHTHTQILTRLGGGGGECVILSYFEAAWLAVWQSKCTGRFGSSFPACLRSSTAGGVALRVCILNAPLASMREIIGRINCGCRAEWE